MYVSKLPFGFSKFNWWACSANRLFEQLISQGSAKLASVPSGGGGGGGAAVAGGAPAAAGAAPAEEEQKPEKEEEKEESDEDMGFGLFD